MRVACVGGGSGGAVGRGGLPKITLDLRPALALLEAGHGRGAVAGRLGLDRSTLRRRREGGYAGLSAKVAHQNVLISVV